MAPALLTALLGRMSLRSLKWSLLLLSVLSFLVMWYLSLPHYNVVERVNLMYFYEYEPIYRQDFRFTLREHSNCSHQNPFLVILVTSHPSDVKARQAIRVTWGSQLKGNARLEHAILVEGEEKELVETLASISTDQSKAHAKPSVRGGLYAKWSWHYHIPIDSPDEERPELSYL
ncbi:hypothetical protein J1605_017118 [Eschrichtius robustus]|uniref:Hexosyltransferase n=1 Tax=Eschrichtius robustus TaxID=9764 RepID=A0AB34I399_ESCRO|nr:hypothetical protein J1605_017118 [Eschrichtius robustus]